MHQEGEQVKEQTLILAWVREEQIKSLKRSGLKMYWQKE